MEKIKKALRIIAIVGLVVAFGNNMGWFIERDRVNLYNTITGEPYRVKIDKPAVKKFLNDYYDPRRANAELRKATIIGIRLTWVTVGDNKPMAGNVHLWLDGDRRSLSFATLDELHNWAYKTPFYEWISFLLLFGGVLGDILIDLISYLKQRRSRPIGVTSLNQTNPPNGD